MYPIFTYIPVKWDGASFGPLFLDPISHDGPAGLSPAARSTLSSKICRWSLVARRWPVWLTAGD